MSKIDHNEFITEMMRYASEDDTPDNIINNLIKYLCKTLKSDRAYIFEFNEDMTLRNTYEYCREGVTKEIDNMQSVPYYGFWDIWFKEFEKHHTLVIRDANEYKKISNPIYNLLIEQGIDTLVTGPVIVDGKTIGFYGVDNPPKEILYETSDIIQMAEFVVSMMIRMRDYSRTAEQCANTDFLTGCKNRTALEWAYDDKYDHGQPITVLMCDVNGLKLTNDTKGHKAGDKLICTIADVLCNEFDNDDVYRVGGDEFVVVKMGESLDEVERQIERVRKNCSRRRVSMSIGMAHYDKTAKNFETLLHEADSKMYEEKRIYHSK